MRIRVAALVIALLTALSVAVAAPARADTGSLGAGSADLLSPNSLFLWQSPPQRYIVVLGAKMGTFGQTPQILQRRLDVGAHLAKTHPFNRMIVSGGNTWWLPVSEAQFMNVGLIRRGVPMWQMVNEGASTNTVQNASNTVAMLKAMGASGALIVTNGFHMPRAMKDFRDAAGKQHARLTFQAAYA
ncbi:YdcF family protein [Gordonia sp. ABSL11-1]|uniref:YdcF family protein n=1 Tax=Gordonia sp. ABSL11-1 TaxID=3053924 RepID=UPI0025736A20|nr:YdcF family protein [Gordonia sp. ABSL11-1]MDL9945151.1 YdcF family protein [Gordonia sp. ABSL11-1]